MGALTADHPEGSGVASSGMHVGASPASPHLDPHPYGAVDVGWLQAWIDENGPWAFHATSRRLADDITTHGLLPSDERPARSSGFSSAAQPRPGHVYLCSTPEMVEHQWELSGVDPAEGVVACVDLRLIDPARLVPDEDPWTLQVLPSEQLPGQLQAPTASEIGTEARWASGGVWAQDVRLGSQSGTVEWAIAHWGRFAVYGRIEPAAVTLADCDPQGRFTAPRH